MVGKFLDQLILPLTRIKRWPGIAKVEPSDDAQHSWAVAVIAHNLALIEEEHFNVKVDIAKVLSTALYHDCMEIYTNDMRSGIKHSCKAFQEAHAKLEQICYQNNVEPLIEPKFKETFKQYFLNPKDGCKTIEGRIIDAADTISALLEAINEYKLGNTYITPYIEVLATDLLDTNLQAALYFIKNDLPGFGLDLDLYGKRVRDYIAICEGSYEHSIF